MSAGSLNKTKSWDFYFERQKLGFFILRPQLFSTQFQENSEIFYEIIIIPVRKLKSLCIEWWNYWTNSSQLWNKMFLKIPTVPPPSQYGLHHLILGRFQYPSFVNHTVPYVGPIKTATKILLYVRVFSSKIIWLQSIFCTKPANIFQV